MPQTASEDAAPGDANYVRISAEGTAGNDAKSAETPQAAQSAKIPLNKDTPQENQSAQPAPQSVGNIFGFDIRNSGHIQLVVVGLVALICLIMNIVAYTTGWSVVDDPFLGNLNFKVSNDFVFNRVRCTDLNLPINAIDLCFDISIILISLHLVMYFAIGASGVALAASILHFSLKSESMIGVVLPMLINGCLLIGGVMAWAEKGVPKVRDFAGEPHSGPGFNSAVTGMVLSFVTAACVLFKNRNDKQALKNAFTWPFQLCFKRCR